MLRTAAAVACALLAVPASAQVDSPQACFLLGGQLSEQPFPSLSQCYKHNGPEGACCVSAHDSVIGDTYSGLFSESCAREFPLLAQYYCLGCDALADSYIDWYNTNKTVWEGSSELAADSMMHDGGADIGAATRSSHFKKQKGKYGDVRLCTSFAKKLMYANGESGDRVDKYDKCGLNYEYEAGQSSPAGLSSMYFDSLVEDSRDGDGDFGRDDIAPGPAGNAYLDSDGSAYTGGGKGVPKSKESYFFEMMRPPFYGYDDGFNIVWANGKEAISTDCFGAAPTTQVAALALAVVALVAQQLA